MEPLNCDALYSCLAVILVQVDGAFGSERGEEEEEEEGGGSFPGIGFGVPTCKL